MADEKERLTDGNYWEGAYNSRDGNAGPFDAKDWRNFAGIQFLEKLEKLGLDRKKVIEIGGGDAQLLCHLSGRHPESEFSVLDFSPAGCSMAAERAAREKVKLNVHCGDVFSPPEALKGAYDLVLSYGLAEHFADLAGILSAKKVFLKPGGTVFTLIPNLASPVYRYLCGRWSAEVLKKHVLHDLESLKKGHERAGLKIAEAGYLSSVEFGMLSMAVVNMEKKRKLDLWLYLWLTRLGKAVHFLEYRGIKVPSSALFSPYIYAAGRAE